MRWCCEALCATGRVSTILGQIAVRVDSIKKNRFADLVRIERDGGIDVVCLAIFWHSKVVGSVISHGGMSGASGSAADEAIGTSCQTPFALQLRDVVFSAQTVGVGLDLAVERFKRYEEEKKKRNVLGLSAWRKSVDLLDLVRLAETQRNGKIDAQLACEVLHLSLIHI